MYARTCGSYMSDTDIIANEEHFQAYRLAEADVSAVQIKVKSPV
jgi:hypothetical protein